MACKEIFDKILDTSFLIEMDKLLIKGRVQLHENIETNLKVSDTDLFERNFYVQLEKNKFKSNT